MDNITLKICAIAGTDDTTKDSPLLWTGRRVGKGARKDLSLSQQIPLVLASTISALDLAQLATILNTEWQNFIRRQKCQRLEIGGSIELTLPAAQVDYAALVVRMLSAPTERALKLVSAASIRALLLADTYKLAAVAVMGNKLEAWRRIGEREMMPTCYAQDPVLSTARATARDNSVLRMIEIAERMPTGDANRAVLEECANLLAAVELLDFDDMI